MTIPIFIGNICYSRINDAKIEAAKAAGRQLGRRPAGTIAGRPVI